MKAFFDSVREGFGPLSQNQVEGLNHLLDATKPLPLRHRAYVLATAWHETGPASSSLHMTPRREIWGPTAAQSGYEGRKDLGNTVPGDGKRFMGRGYVQITGRANYQKASNVTGRDLVANPDGALDADTAGKIIVDGMKNGWFTGRKMGDYYEYKDMRRVVNGTDKADLIAGYATKFERALNALPQEPPKPVPPQPETPVPVPPEPEKPSSGLAESLIWLILGGLGAAFAWVFGGS